MARKKPHIFRRLFTIASVISLVFCLATVVIWMRSYQTRDDWILNYGDDRSFEFETMYGGISFVWGSLRDERLPQRLATLF